MVNPCTPTPQQFDPRSDLNGRTFRNYCPTGIWHEGTCHVVHKANKLTTAELVAIKFYRNNTAMYKTEKDMLKIIRKSNPKNVIRIFDFVDEDPVCPGYNYMVMEYCKCDLAHFVQKQETPLDTQYVKYIIKSILEGIQACHDAKIVHCDIKPKNLMLFSDDEVLQGVWKLGDFDSARRRGQSINSIITIDYTAPEVVVAQHRRRVPAKAECEIDVFALGMLLFYVVVRDTYWDVIGVTGDAKLDKLADSMELTVSNTAVQEDAIQEIIRGLIQKQPGKRTSLKQLRKNPWFTGATSKLEGMVKEIQKDQKEVLRNQEDLLQGQEELKKKSTVIAKFLKAQEKRTGKQLTVIFDELRSMRSFILEVAECTVPRVFIVKPMNRELKDPRSWLTQPFRLHLLCEEGFHLTPHEGYVVKKPLEFLKAYGTYIKLGVWLLLLGAKIAMHGVVPSDVLPETLASLLNDEHIDFIEQADNLTQTVDDYIDKKSEEMSSYTWKGRVSTNGSSYQVLQGQALKNFQAFLEKTDPSFRYGNLERGQHRKTGKMVWVCTQHRTLLNPLSDQESSPARPQAHHLGSTTSTISFSSTSSSSTISLRSEIKTLKKKADKHAANIQDMAAHEHLNKAICRKVAKKVLNAQETLKVMLDGLELDNGETDTMRTQQLQNMCGTLNGYSTILEELELFVKNARGTGGLLKRIFAMNKRDEFDRLCDIMEERRSSLLQMDSLSRNGKSKEGAEAIQQITGLRGEVVQYWDEVATQGLTKELGKFRVMPEELKPPKVKEIRKGSSFTVILQRLFDQNVAVKMLGSLANESLADRLRKEVAVYSYMKPCQHIIEFIGVCEDKNSFNIIMEWATYGDLHSFMLQDQGRQWAAVKEEDRLKMVVEAAEGVAFLHASELVHKDIRSHNILLTKYPLIEYKVKITNFGRSRKFDQHTQRNPLEALERLRWSAPERLAEEVKPYTSECDIYSLGILFWEITQGNGNLPFANISDHMVADHILSGKFHETLNQSPAYARLNIAIHRMWLRKFDLRPTAQEITEYLDTSTVPPTQPKFLGEDVQSKRVDIDMMASTNVVEQMNNININEASCEATETMAQGLEYHKQKQYERAFKVFMAHAAQDDPEAQYWVGYHYFFGHRAGDGKPNYPEALKWLEKSANGGWAVGQYLYGTAYWNGNGVPVDKNEGFKWFNKAATKGDSTAQFTVGGTYYKGSTTLGVLQNKDLGKYYLMEAASKGHEAAQKSCTKLGLKWQAS